MSTYTVRYERDEDGTWLASIPSIQGCHTWGESIPQARERIQEAAGLFVDDAEESMFIDE